ncbi:MAG: hypothetical protein RL748_1774, partial [Pseudomonadota bacterium]
MGNSDKFDLEEIASKVKLALHDPLGKGIEGLKYQIKHGAQVIAEGVTDAEGKVAAFASKVGAELTLHVERFTTNEMKHVRSFVPTAKQYSAKVLSAKVKHEVPLKKDKDAPGDYKRKTYTIKKGDTLGAIAKANGTTAQALATLNGMKVEDTIFEGATLKLPLEKGAAGSGAPAASSSSTPPAAAAPAPAPAPKPAAAPAAAPAPIPIKPIPTTKEDARGENGTPKTAVNLKCDESGCIKIGASGPLVEEINIRLTGFAGGTTDGTSPYNKFSAKTEKAVKAFQRDYMGVAETGIVCGSVLRALDEFAAKYPFPLGGKIQCPCGHCSGWGNGYKESADVDSFENVVVKKDGKNVVVKNSKKHIEAPGIHRSVIWLARTILFYMATVEKDLKYSFGNIESGYRCWWRNSQKKRMSINHMGDALDIHFLKGG